MKVVKNIVLVSLALGLFVLVQSCKKDPVNTQTDFKQEMAVVKEAQYPQQFANQFMLTFFKSIYDSTLLNTGISEIDNANVTMDTAKIRVKYWYMNETQHWHHYDGNGHYRMGTFDYLLDSTFLASTTGVCPISVIKTFYFDSLPTNIQNISIEKTGLSAAGNQTFKATFNNITMSGDYADKTTIHFSAEFNYELFKDPSTPYSSSSDYYLFSGNIQGGTTSNLNYNIVISPDSSRYKIDYQCWYTIEGKSTVTISGGPVPSDNIILNYISGDGCADFYEVTFPGMFSTKSHIE